MIKNPVVTRYILDISRDLYLILSFLFVSFASVPRSPPPAQPVKLLRGADS